MFSQFHRIAFACLCMGMARGRLPPPVVRLFGSALHAAPPSHRRRLSSFPIEFILGSIQKAKASELKRTASGRKRHRSISCACELGQQCAMLQEEHVLLAQTRNNGGVCDCARATNSVAGRMNALQLKSPSLEIRRYGDLWQNLSR